MRGALREEKGERRERAYRGRAKGVGQARNPRKDTAR